MTLKLMVNDDGIEVLRNKVLGPEAGSVFPYYTKGGFPAVVERDDDAAGLFVDPRPGMVVVHVCTLALYQCDVDGQLVPLGLRLPKDYNDGRRLGAEVDSASSWDVDQRQAVLDVINLYGDDVLHKALDDIGFVPRNVS